MTTEPVLGRHHRVEVYRFLFVESIFLHTLFTLLIPLPPLRVFLTLWNSYNQLLRNNRNKINNKRKHNPYNRTGRLTLQTLKK